MSSAVAGTIGARRGASRSRKAKARFFRPGKWLAVIAAVVALCATGFLWLRDSSLFTVKKVTITGLPASEYKAVAPLIRSAADDMTTLHIDQAAFDRVKQRFANIAAINVSPSLPNGLKIEVVRFSAVALVKAGDGSAVPVAADGTLLRGAKLKTSELPQIQTPHGLSGERVKGTNMKAVVRLLATAPTSLQPKIDSAFIGPRGLTVKLASGLKIYFGNGQRARRQWWVARRLLADPRTGGAKYFDVTVASRPAVGGLATTPGEILPGMDPNAVTPVVPATPVTPGTAGQPATPPAATAPQAAPAQPSTGATTQAGAVTPQSQTQTQPVAPQSAPTGSTQTGGATATQ